MLCLPKVSVVLMQGPETLKDSLPWCCCVPLREGLCALSFLLFNFEIGNIHIYMNICNLPSASKAEPMDRSPQLLPLATAG